MVNPDIIKAALSDAETAFRNALASGSQAPLQVAIARRVWELMKSTVTGTFGNKSGVTKTDISNYYKTQAYGQVAIDQQLKSVWATKQQQLGRARPSFADLTNVFGATGTQQTQLTPDFVGANNNAIIPWFSSRPVESASFVLLQPPQILKTFGQESPAMTMLFRLIHAQTTQTSPGGVSPAEALKALKMILPIISSFENSVGFFVPWSVQKIQSLQMTEDLRLVLAWAALIPIVGCIFKQTSAIYSDETLKLLFPGLSTMKPKEFDTMMGAINQAATNRHALGIIGVAADEVYTNSSISSSSLQHVLNSIKEINSSTAPINAKVDESTVAVWNALRAKQPKQSKVRSLDSFAAKRILNARPNRDHVSCQVLQELATVKMASWLGDCHGAFALGVPINKRWIYYPGHLVRTEDGLQVTDGVLGYWNRGSDPAYADEAFVVQVIFEAKINLGGRELGQSPRPDELLSMSQTIWAEGNEIANQMGVGYTKTFGQIQQEVLNAGVLLIQIVKLEPTQLKRDLSLFQGKTRLYLGGFPYTVQLAVDKKVMAIMPQKERATSLEKEAAALNIPIETLGVDIDSKQLSSVVDEMILFKGGRGFRVDGTNILDSGLKRFVFRGVNHLFAYYRGSQYDHAFADIGNTGANTVRVVLTNGKRQPDWGQAKNTPEEISHVLSLCRQSNLITVFDVQDTTGYPREKGAKADSATLAEAVDYWITIRNPLKFQECFTIINIGNEPYQSGDTNWTTATIDAIQRLRRNGFEHLIMVDAPWYGQDKSTSKLQDDKSIMRDHAEEVFRGDPHQNTIFSVHMYEMFGNRDVVTDYLESYKDKNLCINVGEFSYNGPNSTRKADHETILATAESDGIGWLAWGWSGNGPNDKFLDLCENFDPSKLVAGWGDRIVSGNIGLKKSYWSVPASLF